MLTFFTVMIVTYSFNGEEVQSHFLYTTRDACSSAMSRVEDLIDPAMKVSMIQCQQTDTISRSPRPKASK